MIQGVYYLETRGAPESAAGTSPIRDHQHPRPWQEGILQGYSTVLNLVIRSRPIGELGWHDPETRPAHPQVCWGFTTRWQAVQESRRVERRSSVSRYDTDRELRARLRGPGSGSCRLNAQTAKPQTFRKPGDGWFAYNLRRANLANSSRYLSRVAYQRRRRSNNRGCGPVASRRSSKVTSASGSYSEPPDLPVKGGRSPGRTGDLSARNVPFPMSF